MLIPRLGTFARRYRHVHRYREVAAVLLRHGLGDLAAHLGVHTQRRWPFWRRTPPPTPILPTRPERLRLVFEELGPTFVKLGQILSTRRDLFPDAFAAEFERLQDAVRPFPGEQARSIVEQQLGQPIGARFRRFEAVPLASASVAQVHEAETLAGEHVVVKVRRPNIQPLVETDLEIMAQMAGMMERLVEGAALFDPVAIVQEFARVTRRELDFTIEASHMERFARCFGDDPRLRVPKVYRELTTPQVLTMEFVQGLKISRLRDFEAHGLDREKVAALGAELVFEQVFVHGFYHADPHPGNVLVLPGNVICFLDYGMMGVLSGRYREHLSNLVVGLVTRDERRIATAAFRISGNTNFEATDRVEADIVRVMEDCLYRPLRDIRFGEVLAHLTRIAIAHGIRMPPDFFVLTKALTTIEGVGRALSPGFDVMKHAEPLARQLLRERMSVRRMGGELIYSALELQSLLRDLPTEAREILSLLKRGEVRVKFEHRGLEDLISTLDQISSRLVFGLVLAALLVGSSIMVRSDVPPKWHGMPVIGVIGFVVSGLVGFALLYAILRHRRM